MKSRIKANKRIEIVKPIFFFKYRRTSFSGSGAGSWVRFEGESRSWTADHQFLNDGHTNTYLAYSVI